MRKTAARVLRLPTWMFALLAGLFTGTLIGGFVASIFAIGARQRRIQDAEDLTDQLEEDEKLERDYSG